MVSHVTLWFQRENGKFVSFDTIECVKPCYYDGKHDHLKIVLIIATILGPGLLATGWRFVRIKVDSYLNGKEEKTKTKFSH